MGKEWVACMNKVSITEHELVPVHEVLSSKDKKTLLEKYSITKEQLPKIKVSDPVIKHIKAKAGDIVKIVRNSPTAGKSEYYRIVVEE